MTTFPLRVLLALVTSSVFLVSCNLDDDSSPAAAAPKATTTKTTTTTAAADDDEVVADANGSVTGTWVYKHETMVLKQSGSTITGTTVASGFTQNAADPITYPVPTNGSMDAAGVVRVDEFIIYTKNPAKNYRVKKVGKLTDGGAKLSLDVVAGQKAHTQVWIKK